MALSRIRQLFCKLGVCSALLSSSAAFAQGFTADEAAALDIITEFAGGICSELPLIATEEGFRLSGDGQLALNGLLKKLTELGIEGAASYADVSERRALLEKDILGAIEESNNCKLTIWRDLRSKLVSEKNSSYRCPIPGDPSGNASDRSNIFNNKGVEYIKNNEVDSAIECFEQALSHRPGSVLVLKNLFKVYRRDDWRDNAKAINYIDRAIAEIKDDLSTVNVSGRVFADKMEKSCKRFGDCETDPWDACILRSRWTGEAKKIDVWLLKADFQNEIGEPEAALRTLDDLMVSYPKNNCAYNRQISIALARKGEIFCDREEFETASRMFKRSAETGREYGVYGTWYQELLKKEGFYEGPIDGDFGPMSVGAMVRWAKSGCPGLHDDH